MGGSATEPLDATHAEDEALVAACREGNEAAWARLVDKYTRLVFSVAHRCGVSGDDADDVFQVVFTTLFRRLPAITTPERLPSWLITTTYRECWRLGKAARRLAPLDESIVDIGAPPPDLIAAAERDQLVRDALTLLDDRCRELLTLLFLADHPPSYADLAARFGIALGSVGPTRLRCFRRLESILAEYGVMSDE